MVRVLVAVAAACVALLAASATATAPPSTQLSLSADEVNLRGVARPQPEEDTSLVEVSAGVGVVHGFCEICIRMLQMRQHKLSAVCSGLSDTFYITCVKNLESLINQDRSLTYWDTIGCMHEDDGPEVVKPCPAHAVCGWIPNLFGPKVGAEASQGLLPPLCPKDLNYRSRVPKTEVPEGVPDEGSPPKTRRF